MVDKTISSDEIILVDNWPGIARDCYSLPTTFLADAEYYQNSATEAFPLGTKIQGYNAGTAGLQGYFTLIYLKLKEPGQTLAAKHICLVHLDALADGTIYEVTNDTTSDLTTNQPCAIALSAMTTLYYGWFWCGGVCPEDYVSGLGGSYCTLSDIAAGSNFVITNAAATTASFGDFGFDLQDGAAELVAGYALAADD